MSLKIELQNHMLTLTTSDGQMVAINTVSIGSRSQDVIAQWVLEVMFLLDEAANTGALDDPETISMSVCDELGEHDWQYQSRHTDKQKCKRCGAKRYEPRPWPRPITEFNES